MITEDDAKDIIAKFMHALDQSGQDASRAESAFIVHAKESMRIPPASSADDADRDSSEKHQEKAAVQENKEFIALFFANAPHVHNDEIIMERKQW